MQRCVRSHLCPREARMTVGSSDHAFPSKSDSCRLFEQYQFYHWIAPRLQTTVHTIRYIGMALAVHYCRYTDTHGHPLTRRNTSSKHVHLIQIKRRHASTPVFASISDATTYGSCFPNNSRSASFKPRSTVTKSVPCKRSRSCFPLNAA